MSFLKKLFGGADTQTKAPAGDKILGEEEYKSFLIKAVEMKVGSELQLAGKIEKEIAGELKSYSFIRADRMSSREDVTAMALSKGRQIIDEQGEQIFR
ncbi:MAG TPA: HlyU family transcriptional regulator [Devosia sp.]|jgi:hypothetical protein|nr:HlyU family transcriptional regulator [Devosia sp.]